MLLDLAAGYGRHARLVARKRAVTALDINLAYLHNARAGLSAGAKARLHATAADMRLLPFAPSSFGGVMMLFNSFGYFPPEATSPAASSHEQPTAPTREVWRLPTVFYERGLAPEGFNVYQSENDATPEKPLVPDEPTDRALNEGEAPDPNLAVLREVARVLRPEGKFLIEAPNPAPLLAAVRRNPRRHLVMERSIIEDDFFFDEGTKVLGNRTRFVDGKDMHHCGYSLRLYTRGELTAALRSCGFVIEQTKGDYTGSAYESRTSPMMLITARRR
ncbi:hypothetical protein CVU37_10525 [candidate division BRC1 bacterium HGW-BRC1-1]|nr:MAG: hypothetical protein CVU37_10525 [candidate division BRC1 bacterium HGW-BRC1-1]